MMMTLRKFAAKPRTIPAASAWYIGDLSEARGRQELFFRQAPQKLKALREHALIESAVSSNRIEGVQVEQARVQSIVLGQAPLQDRDEEEVRGYRNALNLIHEQGDSLPLSEETICELHRLTRGDIWDAGKYKEKESDIIERFADGRSRVRFKTVAAADTPAAMRELLDLWDRCLEERWVHPLVAMAAFNLDFLCIHPFRDGNGRVSRLLLLLQCYHLGFEAGRFISIERIIEQNKERYYETLAQSSIHWREGRHDPWPYVNYLLSILKVVYKEFEERVGRTKSPRGAKTEIVEYALRSMTRPFGIAEIEQLCPNVSREMIRRVMNSWRKQGKLEILGRGRDARWRRIAGELR
ncbi:MAG: Fic family protein [Desulfobacterales bacterium]|nr:Fic family protein [Desulfobacterales bacterium]